MIFTIPKWVYEIDKLGIPLRCWKMVLSNVGWSKWINWKSLWTSGKSRQTLKRVGNSWFMKDVPDFGIVPRTWHISFSDFLALQQLFSWLETWMMLSKTPISAINPIETRTTRRPESMCLGFRNKMRPAKQLDFRVALRQVILERLKVKASASWQRTLGSWQIQTYDSSPSCTRSCPLMS